MARLNCKDCAVCRCPCRGPCDENCHDNAEGGRGRECKPDEPGGG